MRLRLDRGKHQTISVEFLEMSIFLGIPQEQPRVQEPGGAREQVLAAPVAQLPRAAAAPLPHRSAALHQAERHVRRLPATPHWREISDIIDN